MDYTAAVVVTGPLTIVRERGELTTCRALLDVEGNGLGTPAVQGFVTVTSDAGAVLFSRVCHTRGGRGCGDGNGG